MLEIRIYKGCRLNDMSARARVQVRRQEPAYVDMKSNSCFYLSVYPCRQHDTVNA